MITLLSGGTGTPKFLQGLIELIPEEDISVIVNTGEDVEISGLRVSPDLDAVVYTLAGIIDAEKWYGIEGDSYSTYDMLCNLGHEELLKMGDRDRAVKLYRSMRMGEGAVLSQVTKEICNELDVEAEVMPMTDDRVTTVVDTVEGKMLFHDFWVKRGGKDEVEDVNFIDSEKATPAPGVVESLDQSDFIVIGPSNPVTSLGPMVAVDDIHSALKRNRKKTLAISPIIGDAPVSGPAGALMKGWGYEVNSKSVAEIYKDFVGMFMLHEGDEEMVKDIEAFDMEVYLADLSLPNISSRVRLAEEVLEILDYLK